MLSPALQQLCRVASTHAVLLPRHRGLSVEMGRQLSYLRLIWMPDARFLEKLALASCKTLAKRECDSNFLALPCAPQLQLRALQH
jgi:hypothetical protein